MKSIFILLIAVCAASVAAEAVCAASVAATDIVADKGVSFCYWGSWSIYRPDKGQFGIDQLPADLCTHLLWTFLSVDAETADIIELEPQAVSGGFTNNITQFVAVKEQNPNLKMVVAAGGWSAGSTNFSIVANDETLRAKYVANIVAFLEKYRFDTFDLDWEYPTQREGSPSDLEAFVLLLRDLKAAFGGKYELSIAVGVSTSYIGTAYDVPAISETVDYISLMTYDYHGTWDPTTGVNAPLYDQSSDAPGAGINVDFSVRAWLEAGANPAKLLLGIGTYGKSFNLTSLDNVGTGAPFNAPGEAGPYTGGAGTLAYYEICLDQLENKWNITEVEGNYVYGNRGSLWVGYDNPYTAYAKGQYAKSRGLGGLMFWSLDQDDFANYCGNGTYPIINAAIKGYKKSKSTLS